MHELTGKIKDFSLDYQSGKPKMTIEFEEKEPSVKMYENFKNTNIISFSINDKKPRSTSANAFFWTLCGKIAFKTRQSKLDIYKEFIRNIGDNFEVYAIKDEAVDDFIKDWGQGHLGWVCDILGKSDKEGYTDIVAYYGSSTYSSSQMNALIYEALRECEEQEIEI